MRVCRHVPKATPLFGLAASRQQDAANHSPHADSCQLCLQRLECPLNSVEPLTKVLVGNVESGADHESCDTSYRSLNEVRPHSLLFAKLFEALEIVPSEEFYTPEQSLSM